MTYPHEQKPSRWQPDDVNQDIRHTSASTGIDHSMDWYHMSVYLHERHLSYLLARINERKSIRRKGVRIYIPATTRIPGHVYWQARGIEGQELRYDSPYGPRRDALVITKSNSLKPDHTAVVVEGPMDALAASGVPGHTGIALMGHQPSDEVLAHLVHHVNQYDKVIFVADSDEIAGMAMVQQSVALIGGNPGVCMILDKNDLACYTFSERQDLFKRPQGEL